MTLDKRLEDLATDKAKAIVDYLIENGFTFQVECLMDGVTISLSQKAYNEVSRRAS